MKIKYGYEIYFKVGTHKTLLTMNIMTYETEEEAKQAAEASVQWYIDKAFMASAHDDFLIEYKKLYA